MFRLVMSTGVISVICLGSTLTSNPLQPCPPGSKEFTCDTNCTSNCDGTKCMFGDGSVECLHGCTDGFSGRACNIPCFHNCVRCQQQSKVSCLQCADTFYGLQCARPCPSNCGQDGCYDDGVCKKDCAATDVCANRCLKKCSICSATLKVCEKCMSNFIGDHCEINCHNCNPSGICEPSGCSRCLSGLYGNKCDTPCPELCDSECDQTSGNCTLGCKPGYWGQKCEKKCKGCKNNTCGQAKGRCFECREGRYGIDCISSCDSCASERCERSDGKCIDVTTSHSLLENESETKDLLTERPVTVAFICFGIFSVILVTILFIKLYRRRSLITSPRVLTDEPTVYNNYTEINEEDMDPSSDGPQLIRPYSVTEAGVDVELRLMSERNDLVQTIRKSEDEDSVIIPLWFGQTENNSESAVAETYNDRYLSPLR